MNVVIRGKDKLTGNSRSIRPLPLDQDAFRKQHRSMVRRNQYLSGSLLLTVLAVRGGSSAGELVVQFDSHFHADATTGRNLDASAIGQLG